MYFDRPGEVNTEKTLKLAFDRGKRLGLDEVVIASTNGATAYQALDIFKGFTIIAVTYHGGYKKPFENVMQDTVREDLRAKGVHVISGTHALSGVERSIAKRYSGIYPVLLVADTLKIFGQGVKVAVEVSIMAADAGMLSGKDILAIGGTARGADTCLLLKPANQSAIFDIRIREIICKPYNF